MLENGVRQKVQAFEHVVVSPAGPQSMRAEPNSVRAGEQAAANPRNRVFAIFLDIAHVDVAGSHRIKEPLIRLLDRILGPDDLVAVMTPEMAASQVTFGRKTEVIADMLRDKWFWGIRNSIQDMDEREVDYDRCFPPTDLEMKAGQTRSEVAKKLIARRRERMVLDALRDLVIYLGSVREERKAILAVSNGWLLFRPDSTLTELRVMSAMTGQREPVPGNEPIGVDPFGKLGVGAGRDREGRPASQTICDKDRMYLAAIDDDDYFRLPDGRRQPEQCVVLSDRPARPGGVRFGYRSGTAAAPHRGQGQPGQADRHAADACRKHRRHRHGRHQRSRQGTAAHLGRSQLVLSARLLHDEYEARWPVPPDHASR